MRWNFCRAITLNQFCCHIRRFSMYETYKVLQDGLYCGGGSYILVLIKNGNTFVAVLKPGFLI